MILVILVLALFTGVYALTLGSFAWEDLALGLGLASIFLFVYRRELLPHPIQRSGSTLVAIARFPMFALASIWNIITGTWAVALVVVGIRPLEHPGIVVVPFGDRTPTGAGMSQMLLTLSPGSFLVDVDRDKQQMIIHVIDAADPDAVREELQEFYDRYQRHVVP